MCWKTNIKHQPAGNTVIMKHDGSIMLWEYCEAGKSWWEVGNHVNTNLLEAAKDLRLQEKGCKDHLLEMFNQRDKCLEKWWLHPLKLSMNYFHKTNLYIFQSLNVDRLWEWSRNTCGCNSTQRFDKALISDIFFYEQILKTMYLFLMYLCRTLCWSVT